MKKLFKINMLYNLFTFTMVISVLMSIFSFVLAQKNPWIQKEDMSTGRHSFAASMVNDKIYLIGGRYTDSLVTEYDPATDNWATKTPMPTGRMLPASGVVNGKIYLIGGVVVAYQPALSTVEEYDPVTDAWAQKEDMLTKRLGHRVSVVDGKIYVIGGMTSGSDFWSGMQDSVEVYDPVTNTWVTKAPIPTARILLSTSVVDGKIYAIGGIMITHEIVSTVEVYDPATDTWTTKTSMPTARIGHAAAVVDGIIYVIGGGTEYGQPVGGYSIVEAYNPATDTWTSKANIPQPRGGFSTNVVGGKIYAFGGIPTMVDPHLHGEKTVYEYDPSKDLTALINQFNINKCFMQAGNDSVCITTKISDPAGVTLWAEIESPDQTPIDSLQLFDDGNYNDGNAGDSLYANIWPVNSEIEQYYYLDLHVTRVGTDTVIHYMDNLASFTTIGPIVMENYIFNTSDTIANPGDRMVLQITLNNEGSTAAATDVKASLISLDTLATVISNGDNSFHDIEAGESKTSSRRNSYVIEISEECPANTEIQFLVDITSNDYPFWSDTLSILVVSPTTNIETEENILKQFSLEQNYPNPFNPVTTIPFNLPKSSFVTLVICDCLGRVVKTLISENIKFGSHSVTFNASNISSGLYFYKLQAGDKIETRKMLLIK
jgi:N-acetylneuraminic acid mutarotase